MYVRASPADYTDAVRQIASFRRTVNNVPCFNAAILIAVRAEEHVTLAGIGKLHARFGGAHRVTNLILHQEGSTE